MESLLFRVSAMTARSCTYLSARFAQFPGKGDADLETELVVERAAVTLLWSDEVGQHGGEL